MLQIWKPPGETNKYTGRSSYKGVTNQFTKDAEARGHCEILRSFMVSQVVRTELGLSQEFPLASLCSARRSDEGCWGKLAPRSYSPGDPTCYGIETSGKMCPVTTIVA